MAAIGRVQLTRLDGEFAPKRRELAELYRDCLLYTSFAGVPVGRGMLGGEGPRLVGLELDGVRAAEGGFVDEAAGDVHAAFMVHTGFGDDVGTLEAGDRDGVLADEVDEVHKTLRELSLIHI